jgi:hypothetical protein
MQLMFSSPASPVFPSQREVGDLARIEGLSFQSSGEDEAPHWFEVSIVGRRSSSTSDGDLGRA